MSARWARWRTVAIAVAVIALTATVAGCGVGTDEEARDISADAVPFDLLAPTSSTSTSSTTPVARVTVPVYLVDSANLLVEVRREVALPVTISAVVDALLEGATDEEAAKGFRSAIPAGTQLLSSDLDLQTGVVVLDLSAGFAGVVAGEQRLALAQVVFTATGLRTVNGVLFEIDGELSEVPDGEGAAKATPLARRDYARFDPEVAATSTTTTPPPPLPEN